MGGFVVYGIPAGKIDAMVARRVQLQEQRLKNPPKPGTTERRAIKHRASIEAAPPPRALIP